MLTYKYIERTKQRFANGDKPKLVHRLWYALCLCQDICSGNRWENKDSELYLGNSKNVHFASSIYFKALVEFGLVTEKFGLTKLGHYYYENWTSI